MRLIAGRDLQRRRLDLEVAAVLEPAPRRADDAIAGQKERAAVVVDVGAPPGGRGSRVQRLPGGPDVRPRGAGGGDLGPNRIGPRPTLYSAKSCGRLRPSPSSRIRPRESRRQLAPQRQCRRHRRQALCDPDRREHSPGQGHPGQPVRHAPHFRRREGVRALPHHRAARARLRRRARVRLPVPGRRGLSLHEPGKLRPGRGSGDGGRRRGGLSAGRHEGHAAAARGRAVVHRTASARVAGDRRNRAVGEGPDRVGLL